MNLIDRLDAALNEMSPDYRRAAAVLAAIEGEGPT